MMLARAEMFDVSSAEEGDDVLLLRRADAKMCAALEDAVTTPEPAPPRR